MRPRAKIDPSRKDEGRKIDAWRFDLPDGSRLDIHIRLHSGDGRMWFTTANTHPVFRHLSHKATDLQILRADVERDVHEVIASHFSASWAPAFLVEAERRHDDHDENPYRGARRDVSLRLSVAPVHLDTTRPVSNRGVTRVIANDKPFDVVQRALRDRFDVDRKSLDSDNLRFASEQSADISRAVLRESRNLEQDLAQLQDAIDRFSILLADRLAPDEIARHGIVQPQELVGIMAAAAADPDAGHAPPALSDRDDEFRM